MSVFKTRIFVFFVLLCIMHCIHILPQNNSMAAQSAMITLFFNQQVDAVAMLSNRHGSFVTVYNGTQRLNLIDATKANVKEIKKYVTTDFFIYIELNVYEIRNICTITMYDLTVSRIMNSYAFTYISLTNLNNKLKLFFDAYIPIVVEYKSNAASIIAIQSAIVEKDKKKILFNQVDNLEHAIVWNIDELFAFILKERDFLGKYKYFYQEEAVINARMVIAKSLASELYAKKTALQRYEVNKVFYCMVTLQEVMKEATAKYLRFKKNQTSLSADIISFLLNF